MLYLKYDLTCSTGTLKCYFFVLPITTVLANHEYQERCQTGRRQKNVAKGGGEGQKKVQEQIGNPSSA